MPGYDTILVTTDLSDPSLTAVRRAGDLAGRLGSRILLAYVIDDHLPPLILAYRSEPADQLLEEHRQNAEQALQKTAADQLSGLDVETMVAQGTVHVEVARLAREHDVALIVIGMHGHGFLTHALAGSTAERVLHRAPCPVLVVPHDS